MADSACPICSIDYVVKVTYQCHHSLCIQCDIDYRQKGKADPCHICRRSIQSVSYASTDTIIIKKLTGALIPLQVNLLQTTLEELYYMAVHAAQYPTFRLIFKDRSLREDSKETLSNRGILDGSIVTLILRMRAD